MSCLQFNLFFFFLNIIYLSSKFFKFGVLLEVLYDITFISGLYDIISQKTQSVLKLQKGIIFRIGKVGEIIELHYRTRTSSEDRKNKWKFIVSGLTIMFSLPIHLVVDN